MLNKNNLNFFVLTGLFFGWGFVTCLNDLLTPIMKHIFTLSHYQANLVSFAFFTAYFVGSLFYLLSPLFGIKFFINLGYKGLILLGLILTGSGCFIFIPAAMFKSYLIFLCGLFSIGFGFTFLQISANPLIIISGNPDTGASRLNIAGGFNSLATTIAPLIGVYIFYNILNVSENQYLIKYPYIVFGIIFLLFAVIIYLFLDTKENTNKELIENKLISLNYSNLLFGALAIFFYVGSEVAIGSNLVSLLKDTQSLHLEESLAGKYLAFYWGGAMIGRFLGGTSLSSLKMSKKIIYMLLTAIILTILILYTSGLQSTNINFFILYQLLAIILFIISSSNVRLNLILFAFINSLNLLYGAFINSELATWAIISSGIFNSIMWPNIFDLAIFNLGKYREQGSSVLIMMILGGAILPVIQGKIADIVDIKISFIIPACGYIYILLYGIFYSKKYLNIVK